MIIAEFNEKLTWIESLALTIEKKINPTTAAAAAVAVANPYEVHKEHEKRVMESKRCWVLLQVGNRVVLCYFMLCFVGSCHVLSS